MKASELETLLRDNIFADTSLKASYSPLVINYDIDPLAETEIKPLTHKQRINFFQLLIRTQDSDEGVNMRRRTFPVTIRYVVEADPKNTAQSKVRDGLEALYAILRAKVVEIYQAIDFVEYGDGIAPITQRSIGGAPCWQSELQLNAVKSV
jgi:hypothetical protein